MTNLVQVAVRLLALYGALLVGPSLVGAVDRFVQHGGGTIALAVTLTLLVGLVIPVLVWLLAPGLARAAVGSEKPISGLSVNIGILDGLFLAIVTAGIIQLSYAVTNIGQILALLIGFPRQGSEEAETILQLQYSSELRESLIVLVLRLVVGFLLVTRGRHLARKVAG